MALINIRQLEEGDAVEFNLGIGDNGREQAIEVRKKYQASPETSCANPGINPAVELNHFNQDEQRIIKFLGRVFYVTSGGFEFQLS